MNPSHRTVTAGLLIACIVLSLLLAGRSLAQAPATAPSTQTLKSPDGKIAVTFRVNPPKDSAGADGKLVYSVTFNDKPLLDTSTLQLELKGQPALGAAVHIVSAEPSSHDSTYKLVTGKTSVVRDHYNALRLDLAETRSPQRQLTIEARVYDDAVALRYIVPKQPAIDQFRLAKESTQFLLSKDATCYALVLPHEHSMYESEFLKLPASAFANRGGVVSSSLIGLPMLIDVPGAGWMAITEADLHDYAGMYLVNNGHGWSSRGFESHLSPRVDDPELCVIGELPHASPWRVLMIADDPGRLIESNVITSLNPPSAIEDTSWIHAGKCAWDWWSGSIGPDGKSDFNDATMRWFIDFAAKSGLEYMLIDAGWSSRKDALENTHKIDVPALAKYAKAKGVKLWIWCHWEGLEKQIEPAFALFEKWGVSGVKIDFMSRDDQQMVDFYYRVAQTAAKHRLMIDFHGAYKPTGMERTWPNVLGYEAVLGMEQSKAGARDNPEHRTMLPFTRMLAGEMDYTPGGFDNVTREAFVPRSKHPMVMGTRAAQLAMYVVYFAPFQMVADHPAAYEGQKAFEFIRAVPATWDETRVLAGRPGQFITIARRSGDDWFIGSMTDWTPRELDIPLSFLKPGRYTAEIYADAADAERLPKHVQIEHRPVGPEDHLRAKLAPGGGYAVRIHPEKAED